MLQITAGGVRRISALPADLTETRIAFVLKREQRANSIGMQNFEGDGVYTRTACVYQLPTDRSLAIRVTILAQGCYFADCATTACPLLFSLLLVKSFHTS
jgi:hypothetical protein